MRCPPKRARSPELARALVFGVAVALGAHAHIARADDTGSGSNKPPETVGKQPVTGAAPPALPPPSIEAPTTPVPPAAPKHSWKPVGPPKPPLPVEMTITAASADPPWTLRIKNVGEHPIRIAADARLLSFELDTGEKRGRKVKCTAPSALRPSGFPNLRELYLEPGEVYAEDFDPRLYCFGDNIYLLQGGTTVRAHMGWPSHGAQGRGPFVAQGTDRPEAFGGLTELSAPPILLSFGSFAPDSGPVPPPPTSNLDATTSSMPNDATSDPSKSTAQGANGDAPWTGYKRMADVTTKDGSDGASWTKDWVNGKLAAKKPANGADASPSLDKSPNDDATAADALGAPADSDGDDQPDHHDKKHDKGRKHKRLSSKELDRNAGHVDVFVNHYSDASAPRDVVINIRAANDGKRALVAAIRGRMLSFTVEQLGPDNKPTQTFDCRGSDGPHAMPIESIHDIGAGQAVVVPIMLAEVCPPEVFERPGLYRVRPRIDTEVDGEMLEAHPYLGKALALQSSLVRVATSRRPFQDDQPRVAIDPSTTDAHP